MLNFQQERLRKLPQHQDDTWQGGWIRSPMWAKGPDGKPLRPWMPVWVSLKTGLVGGTKLIEAHEKTSEAALTTLTEFASDGKIAGYIPGKIEVNDPALAEYLKAVLADLGISVQHRPTLFGLKHFVSETTKAFAPKTIGLGLMDVPGMTVGRVRAFADAAKAFYDAAPWSYLDGDDVVSIEAPQSDELIRHAVVLGSASIERGLGFMRTVEDFWKMHGCDNPDEAIDDRGGPVCNLLYNGIWEIPIPDADLWEDEGLPVAGGGAYPLAACYGPGKRIRRPSTRRLAFEEGILRALTATTEDELDSGRWTKEVVTFDGAMLLRLSLPHLLNPPTRNELARAGVTGDDRAMERGWAEVDRRMARSKPQTKEQVEKVLEQTFADKSLDDLEYTPKTATEKAQDLCYQAFDAFGRRRVKLARQALELDPDCADAYVIIAERLPDGEEARASYQRGVIGGERSLGPEAFKKDTGHFWGIQKTRPYMRALFGLAESLYALERLEEAVDHMWKLIELNPNDNQGVRDLLLPVLIEMGRDSDAAKLRRMYKEKTAISLYAAALLAFRKSGDGRAATTALKEAVKANRYVPRHLLQPPAADELPEFHGFGSEEEAIVCASNSIGAWRATLGALEWLKKETGAQGKDSKGGRDA